MDKPVLAFETSLGGCSAALWRNGKVTASEYEQERNRQTERLMPMIESVLKQSDTTLAELGLIATTSGPGSFTGIRIGLAVARGMALALKAPVVAVGTLELLAWQARDNARIIAASINAYRGERYLQNFSYETKLQPLSTAESVPADRLKEHLPAEYCKLVIDEEQRPDAAALAEYVATQQLTISDYPPQPLYIRAPDAKLPGSKRTA